MGVFNLFKKKSELDDTQEAAQGTASPVKKRQPGMGLNEMLKSVDTSKMSLKEKMALKVFARLSPEKQQAAISQMMNPAAIQKAIRSGKVKKEDMLRQIDQMVQSGMLDKGQAEAFKSHMGLR